MFKKGLILVVAVCFSYQLVAQTTGPKQIVLAWDASFSMSNRVLENDFKFLDNYFERNKDIVVDLIVFSNDIIENEKFVISNGNWEGLKNTLLKVPYDGATNLKVVETIVSLNHYELLLFTDGAQSVGTDIPSFGIKMLLINSNPYREQMDLNALLVKNKARLFDYGRPIFLDQSEKQEVVNASESLEKSNSENEPITSGIKLDEVVVNEKQRAANPVETVNIGNGEVDKNRLGVAAQSIGDEQISPITTDVSRAIQGKFSGVQLGQEDDLSRVTMRTMNSMQLNNYGLIVIDGVPMEQADSGSKSSKSTVGFGFVDPANIADITVLKGMAATTRYGTLGANGVILITTKSSKGPKINNGKPVDRALLKNNVYDGDLSFPKKAQVPIYIAELKKIGDKVEAYLFYLKQRAGYLDSPTYFLDVYDYFKPIEIEKAQRILSNVAEINAKNIAILRILVYTYEAEGDFTNALKIGQQILDLDENSTQSKLDLALLYEETKKYKSAYELLSELVNNNTPQTTDFSAMNKTATNSLRNILKEAGSSIIVNESDKKYQNQVRYDARILILWNKSNAEFELQIINPDKRFFTWEHSELNDPKTYKESIISDINTEEFHLIDAQKGNWFIKANDVSQHARTEPVYLKCLVYYNFGLPSQRKEIKTLKLISDGKSETLFKIGI